MHCTRPRAGHGAATDNSFPRHRSRDRPGIAGSCERASVREAAWPRAGSARGPGLGLAANEIPPAKQEGAGTEVPAPGICENGCAETNVQKRRPPLEVVAKAPLTETYNRSCRCRPPCPWPSAPCESRERHNHPCPCKSSCPRSRHHRTCSRPGPCSRFCLCSRVWPRPPPSRRSSPMSKIALPRAGGAQGRRRAAGRSRPRRRRRRADADADPRRSRLQCRHGAGQARRA